MLPLKKTKKNKKPKQSKAATTKPHNKIRVLLLLLLLLFVFVFCVPGHARSSVRRVRRSPQSTAVSQSVPKACCGHPPDWAMSGVSKRQRWGRIAGFGWEFKDLCSMDIRLQGKFSACGGGRRVDSVQFSVYKL